MAPTTDTLDPILPRFTCMEFATRVVPPAMLAEVDGLVSTLLDARKDVFFRQKATMKTNPALTIKVSFITTPPIVPWLPPTQERTVIVMYRNVMLVLRNPFRFYELQSWGQGSIDNDPEAWTIALGIVLRIYASALWPLMQNPDDLLRSMATDASGRLSMKEIVERARRAHAATVVQRVVRVKAARERHMALVHAYYSPDGGEGYERAREHFRSLQFQMAN